MLWLHSGLVAAVKPPTQREGPAVDGVQAGALAARSSHTHVIHQAEKLPPDQPQESRLVTDCEECEGTGTLVYRFIEVYPLLGEGRERFEFLPTMDYGTSINFRDPLEDAIAEFLPRVNPDMS